MKGLPASLPARCRSYANRHPVRFLIFWALCLNLILEILGRHSLIAGVGFLVLHPYLFCYNSLILLFTLSFTALFRRQIFVLSTVTLTWLTFGVTNCVLLAIRSNPFSAIDFSLLISCLPIINIYLAPWQLVLVCAALLLAVAFLVLLFFRSQKYPRSLKRGVAIVLILAVLLTAASFLSFGVGGVSSRFDNLADAYLDYGFVFGFSMSVLDRGIDRPDDYSGDIIDSLLEEIQESTSETIIPGETPVTNVVFVQLESFFDVNRLADVTFSENPVPIFTALKETCSSGYLTVPTIGAGTVNTEFEILSGMSIEYFGAGEYPYKTILRETTCETVAYNLKSLGLTAHAIHNNTGTFYDRHKVYASLGFDTFTPLEYMNGVEYNPLGWAKDKVLVSQIRACLDSTEGSDFVFAVSVQPHGRYPDDTEPTESGVYDTVTLFERLFGKDEKDNVIHGGHMTGNVETTLTADEFASQRITVSGIDDASLAAQYRYYVNQLYETDAFIGALIAELSLSEEPVILVLYGDHLPSLDYTAEDLADGTDPYQSEYVIWSNRELEKRDADLTAYQLAAEVLSRLDIHEGVLTAFHQTYRDRTDYQTMLEMLEYDMLYGDQNAWDGTNPYAPTKLKMGALPVTVLSTKNIGTTAYIRGENFTPFSTVILNGTKKDTIFFDSQTLAVEDCAILPGDVVTVVQAGTDNVILSETAPFTAAP